MDVFEQFETRVIEFGKEHIFSILLIGSIFVIITLMALTMTAIAGVVGIDYAYKTILEKNNATEVQNWDTLIIPLATILFNYQGYLEWAIAIGWTTLVIYVAVRAIYRFRKTGEAKI